jgi:hypothetical protein
LLVAAFPVLEGWSAELMLEAAAETDDTNELNSEVLLLKTEDRELCAAETADVMAEAEADKALVSVLTRYCY